MKAMILAAGLGLRLRPLTSKRAKALIPVANRPLIDRTIEYLKAHGVNEIVVNAHHLHQQIVKHLDGGRPFGINIEVRVEPEILGTGGGIKNTSDFWNNDPFIVVNGDILTNIDLSKPLETHIKNRGVATLVLHDCKPFNKIQIDSSLNITDIPRESHSHRHGRLAFTGIHIIEPELLNFMQEGVFFDVIDCYRELIKTGTPVKAHVSAGHKWWDLGTVKSYILANKEALKENSFLQGPGCQIHSSVKLKDWAIIGEKARLEEGVEIIRSILWEKVRVKKGRKVINSVVTSSREIAFDLIDKVF